MRRLVLALKTDGVLGDVPDWYPPIKAAQFLKVPPWILVKQAKCWEDWALIARAAEAEVQAWLQSRGGGA
jgi:hypothetical protein